MFRFFDNFNFWTPLFCKNGPNFCQISIPPFQKALKFSFKSSHFYAKIYLIFYTYYWHSTTKVILVNTRYNVGFFTNHVNVADIYDIFFSFAGSAPTLTRASTKLFKNTKVCRINSKTWIFWLETTKKIFWNTFSKD